MTETEQTPAEILEKIKERVRNGVKPTLAYVSQGDGFDDEQVAALLTDSPWEQPAMERFNEWESDSREEGYRYWLESELSDDEREAIETGGLEDDLREFIFDLDDSNLYQGLLGQTGHKLWQWDTGVDTFVSELTSVEECRQDAEVTLNELGLDVTDDALDRFAEAIQNAYAGARVYVVWYGDVETAVSMTHSWDKDGNQVTYESVTFTDAHLVLINGWNGSGSDVDGTFTLTRPWDPKAIALDSQAGGYSSWNAIAGVHGPYYAAGDITLNPKQEDA